MNHILSVRSILLFLLYFIPNSTLLSQEQIRVACVGDSITYGYGLLNKENNYPNQLATLLPESWIIQNFGVNGACAGYGLPDSYAQTGMIEAIRQWNPHIILIMLGSNDSKESNWKGREYFIQGFDRLINAIKDEDTDVLVQLPPPSGINSYGIRNILLQKVIRPALIDYSEEHHYPVVDFSSDMVGNPLFYLDNVHPNKWGYNIIRNRIFEKLQSLYPELKALIP